MRKSLFRREAVEGLTPRLEGSILTAQRLPITNVAKALVAFVAVLAVTASAISAPVYLNVIGQLQSDTGLTTLRAPTSGFLSLSEQIPEAVDKDFVLATIRNTDSFGARGQVVDAKRRALESRKVAQVAALESEISSARFEVKRLQRQIEAIQATVLVDKSALQAAEELQEMAERQLARARSLLADGVVTKQSVEDAERAAAERRVSVLQARQALRRDEGEILQLQAQLAASQSRVDSTASQGSANLALADSELVDLDQRASQSVTSPYAGKILAVHARPGLVQRDDVLFTLSSSDNIEAVAVVPESVAQKLAVGARATVQIFGTSLVDLKVSEGTLTDISKGVVSMSIMGEQQVGHIARIQIKRPAFKLSPGSRVAIKLQAKEQRLIGWLFPSIND